MRTCFGTYRSHALEKSDEFNAAYLSSDGLIALSEKIFRNIFSCFSRAS